MKRYKRFMVIFCAVISSFFMDAEAVLASGASSAQYWPEGPGIVSAAGIVMEVDTGTILYEKNIHEKHYPASITKILTALLVIENSDMNEIVTFSHDSVYKTEGSGIARDVGEEMTVEQCLYAMMLASSNESAYALAEHTAGNIDVFIQAMNDKAASLGCTDSHFNNCHGLPDENHYTSAYDMAIIAREAYKNDVFRIICGSKTYTIPFTNKHKDEETYLQNHHQMLYPLKTRKYLYDDCLGGKTGYTTVANNTLVTYAERNGMTLICVVLDAPSGSHYEDTRALFDFCFDNFKKVNILENETADKKQVQERKSVFGSYEPFVALDSSGSIVLPITAEFSDAESETLFSKDDKETLGCIRYTYAGRIVGEAALRATNATVNSFEFKEGEDSQSTVGAGEKESGEKEGTQLKIDVKKILFIFLGIAAAAAAGFLIYKLADNFYRIKHKIGLRGRERSPYKTIKQNKKWRNHRRKWF